MIDKEKITKKKLQNVGLNSIKTCDSMVRSMQNFSVV